MSKNKSSVLPVGRTEKEINELAEEAFENGEMTAVDILGNEEPITKEAEILNEMITGEEKPLPVDRVLNIVKHLQGKTLTIIDATYQDKEKIKFVKDLVKEAFSSSANWIYDLSIRNFEEVEK